MYVGDARVSLFRDKSDAEKSLLAAEGGCETRIRNRFRYELSLFLRSRRTCHIHTYTCVSFSRAQVDAHARSRAAGGGRGGRTAVASSKRDATGREGERAGAAGNVARGTESRKIQVAP